MRSAGLCGEEGYKGALKCKLKPFWLLAEGLGAAERWDGAKPCGDVSITPLQ